MGCHVVGGALILIPLVALFVFAGCQASKSAKYSFSLLLHYDPTLTFGGRLVVVNLVEFVLSFEPSPDTFTIRLPASGEGTEERNGVEIEFFGYVEVNPAHGDFRFRWAVLTVGGTDSIWRVRCRVTRDTGDTLESAPFEQPAQDDMTFAFALTEQGGKLVVAPE